MKPEQTIQDRIARARQLLAEIHHIPLATVNDDGTPHNSPLFMTFDGQLNGYWVSSSETLHSKNIARDGRIFMVIFDSREGHGGLYIEAHAKALQSKTAAEHGLQTLKKLKQQLYGDMGGMELYTGEAEQRIYQAKPIKLWINKSDRNDHGIIVRDRRHEITLDQLLG